MNIDTTNITRVEVINHAKNSHTFGRLLTLYKELDDFDGISISIQDGGRTLKIFLDSYEKNTTPDKKD